jgi:DNA-binding CsgD family transcriptional regulator
MSNPWGLSQREGEVLMAILMHGSAKVAARNLFISPRTVEAHVHRILPRMSVSTCMQAVVLWDRWYTAQRAATANARLLKKLMEAGIQLEELEETA